MAIDWTDIYAKYPGKWVAFADDEMTVVASGDDAHQVLSKSVERGIEEPILHRVPEQLVTIIGVCSSRTRN